MRLATLRDLGRIKEIEDAAFSRQKINETAFTLKSRIVAFPKGCFVATQNGNVVGYALSELRGRITRFALNYDAKTRHSGRGPYLYLAGLAVDRGFRGRGIGTALLKRVIATAKKLKLQAVVLASWYARHYYPKFGFKIYRKVFNKKGKLNYYIFCYWLR